MHPEPDDLLIMSAIINSCPGRIPEKRCPMNQELTLEIVAPRYGSTSVAHPTCSNALGETGTEPAR